MIPIFKPFVTARGRGSVCNFSFIGLMTGFNPRTAMQIALYRAMQHFSAFRKHNFKN